MPGTARELAAGQLKEAVMIEEGEVVKLDFLPAVEVQGRVYLDGDLISGTVIGAAHSSGSVNTKLQVDELGVFSGKLPVPGVWTFWYDTLSLSQEVQQCPCVIDLFFTTAQPG